MAGGVYAMADQEAKLACFRSYNDWLLDEFCAADRPGWSACAWCPPTIVKRTCSARPSGCWPRGSGAVRPDVSEACAARSALRPIVESRDGCRRRTTPRGTSVPTFFTVLSDRLGFHLLKDDPLGLPLAQAGELEFAARARVSAPEPIQWDRQAQPACSPDEPRRARTGRDRARASIQGAAADADGDR
jgi:hypothetical protein